MKKFFLILILFLFLLSGCRFSAPKDAAVLILGADPLFLNPVLAYEMASIEVNSMIFNSLLKYNEKLEIEGDLAERWEVSKDGKVWIFHLRKGVKWHDGVSFTAKDVKFTFDKLLDPKTNTYNRALFQINGKDIKFKIIDDYTIQAVLLSSFAPFEANLTLQGIVPQHILEGQDINLCEFNVKPVGTGPFKFSEWQASDHIILTANPDYFLGKPKLNRLIYRIIGSSEAKIVALQTSQIDICSLSPQDVILVRDNHNITIHRWLQFTYQYIGFDLTYRLFKDASVRRAINYAIDKKALVEAVLQDHAVPATGPIPMPSWAYSKNVKTYDYNPRRAKKLLEESGWEMESDGVMKKNGMNLEFNLMYSSGGRESEKTAVLVQNYLKVVGIKVNLRSTERNVLINACNPGKFQAVVMNWVEFFEPDCTLFTEWDSSQIGTKGMNFMSYSNPEVDKILKEARTVLDKKQRKKLYKRFQQIIVDDAPYVFLWYPKSVIAVNKRLKGLSPDSPAGLMVHPERVYIEE